MTTPLTSAQSAQQNNRTGDGKYATKSHSEAEVSLSDVGLTDALRQAIAANRPLVRLETRDDDEPPVILEDPQNYPFTVGEYQDWDVATEEEVQSYRDHHNDLYDADEEKRQKDDQALHNIQEELQNIFDSSDRGYAVKSVDYDRERHDLIAQIDTGDGTVRPWAVGNAQDTDPQDPAYKRLEEHDQGFGGYSWRAGSMRRDHIGDIDCGWEKTEREQALEDLGDNFEFSTHSLRDTRSPWGTVQDADPTGSPHIAFVSTDSHGGFKVSQGANKLIPAPLRKRSGWYEEDCERAHVIASFPTATRVGTGATPSSIHRSAVNSLKRWNPDKGAKAGFIAD